MENILYRIELLTKKEGVTITALERKIGASKGVLSRALNNNTDIQAKWIQSIVENYPQYSPEWLLTGKGSMLKSDYKNDTGFIETENSKLVRDLIDKNERLSQRIGELVNENAHLRKNIMELQAEINVLKKEMANKNTQRNSVYSYPDIAAEPEE